MTFPVDPKLKTKVREQVQATVSQLPLTVNDAVLGYIHYFSGRGKNTMIAGLRRAGRYRPLVQRILDEEGLPPGIDSSGAGGIRLFAASDVQKSRRGHVAIRSVARAGIRPEPKPLLG